MCDSRQGLLRPCSIYLLEIERTEEEEEEEESVTVIKVFFFSNLYPNVLTQIYERDGHKLEFVLAVRLCLEVQLKWMFVKKIKKLIIIIILI
jgi:hypothetical protein